MCAVFLPAYACIYCVEKEMYGNKCTVLVNLIEKHLTDII